MPPLAPQLTTPDAYGAEYYRGLLHWAGSSELQQFMEQEFPELSRPHDATDRRGFLRLLGASMALAGLTSTGCRRWPVEEIRPHTARPEGFSPGVAEHYATCLELDGVATGILAKSYDGRPIKIEGNPDHPFSLGAASSFAQASVLELYDPDRSRHCREYIEGQTEREQRRTWDQFDAFAATHFDALRRRQGEGLAFLIQPTASPTWTRLQEEFTAAFPQTRWFAYQPLQRDHEFVASRAAFGQALRPQYDLARANTIVSFDADLLGSHPASLRLARDWSSGRRKVDAGEMNRLYAFEPSLSITGSVADVRVPMRPSSVAQAIDYVAHRLGILATPPRGLNEAETAVLENVVRDLRHSGAAGVVAASPAQSVRSHQLVHAINQHLGSVGHTLVYTPEPLAAEPGVTGSIGELSDLLQGNVVTTLVIIGGNPVYDGPADAPLNLSSNESKPVTTIHLSLHDNETSRACQWHLPAAHFLEAWGDGRAWDGTYTLQQPLIEPLFGGRSPIELLALLAGQSAVHALSLVRVTFDQEFPGSTQRDWELALHAGVKQGSGYAPIDVPEVNLPSNSMAETEAAEWEVCFVADRKVHDGRFANNAWLQELPEPLTKLTWDNAALVSPADADRLGLQEGQVIRIQSTAREAAIEIPITIMPGHATGCLTLPLGYGRTAAGHIGHRVGVDVYPLRGRETGYVAHDCSIAKTGAIHQLATTQEHHALDAVGDEATVQRLGERGRPGLIVHEALLPEFQRNPHAVHGTAHEVHPAPLFDLPDEFDTPHKWGMSIDMNACIGCSNCVVACQAENNIPVVGKANVAVHREMHWLRIDRYFKGDLDSPDVIHQPLACVHCENAPCEQVCPVAATVHDSEGLNAMVYNRCIGTRYCANNCPYKVRRFNYFDYQASDPRTPAKPWLGMPDRQQSEDVSILQKMVHNPEVTVRMRGVMEKCTYCVQRIVDARITAKNEHAQGTRDAPLVAEGEVQTACQATCPTRAIVFGDLNDPESAVSQARRNVRSYELLAGQNLAARTTYLAKIRNRES